jgi:hypothetical protein
MDGWMDDLEGTIAKSSLPLHYAPRGKKKNDTSQKGGFRVKG